MHAQFRNPPTPKKRFHDVLLEYLLNVEVRFWPGSDGQTLEEALEAYAQQALAGHVPGEKELLELYPDLAHEVREFFVLGSGRPLEPSGAIAS